jgi:hypothetical protein
MGGGSAPSPHTQEAAQSAHQVVVVAGVARTTEQKWTTSLQSRPLTASSCPAWRSGQPRSPPCSGGSNSGSRLGRVLVSRCIPRTGADLRPVHQPLASHSHLSCSHRQSPKLEQESTLRQSGWVRPPNPGGHGPPCNNAAILKQRHRVCLPRGQLDCTPLHSRRHLGRKCGGKTKGGKGRQYSRLHHLQQPM